MNTDPKYSLSPPWWTEDHESRWDRVKAAFHRDWEQTKADLSGGQKGEELNQDVGDTMGQAFGKRPVPGEGTPNPMTADELAKEVKRSEKQMDRAAEHLAKDTEKAIERSEKEARKEEKEALKEVKKELKEEEKLGTAAARWSRWEDAERPLRYGHGAATFYGPNWTADTEHRMQREWTALYPGQSWDDVRDTIRAGWTRGRY